MKTYQLAMTGQGHIKSNTPCQDKTAEMSVNGVTSIALADGAGSASLSHFGAESVTREAVKILCENFDRFYSCENVDETSSTILSSILARLKIECTNRNCELSDLASTLLFVSCNEGKYIAGQIGDGCLAYARDGKCELAIKPEKGEFANSTFFITSPNPEYHLKLFKGKINNITGFMIMSDGAAESLYRRKDNYVAPIVYKFINDIFYKSKNYLRDTFNIFFEKNILTCTSDDCSIAAINTWALLARSIDLGT